MNFSFDNELNLYIKKRNEDPGEALIQFEKMYNFDLESIELLRLDYEIAKTKLILYDYEGAEKIYTGLLQNPELANFRNMLLDIKLDLGILYYSQGNLPKSEICYQEAIQLSQDLKDTIKENEILSNYATMQFFSGKEEEGYKIIQCVLQEFETNSDIDPSTAYNISGIYHCYHGMVEESIPIFEAGASFAYRSGNLQLYFDLKNNLAYTYMQLGKLEESRKILKDALEIAKEHKLANIYLLSVSYGELLIVMGELSAANKVFEEILHDIDKIQIATRIDFFLTYPKLLAMKGNYVAAIKELNKGLDLTNQKKIDVYKPEIEVLLAEMYFYLDDFENTYSKLKSADDFAWKRDYKSSYTKTLILRARINQSQLNYYEAEMHLIHARRLSEESKRTELQFTTLLLLAQNYLLKSLNQINLEENFSLALNLINEAVDLAKTTNMLPNYINALMVKGVILSNNDPDLAKTTLQESMELAKECGILRQARYAQEKLNYLKTKFQQTEKTRQNNDAMSINLVLQEIERVVSLKAGKSITEDDLDSNFMLVFKIDEILGPTLHESYNIDEDDPQYMKEIYLSGMLYSSTLGQGQHYHEGLFGPFPFGEGSLRSIVYSKMIFDPSQKQKRNAESTYVLFCIVFQQNLNPLFYDRDKVEEIFLTNLNKIAYVQDIKSDFLKRLTNEIKQELMQKLNQV